MTSITDIAKTLEALQAHAPSGFALAMRINFTTPSYLFQTFPTKWTNYYADKGFMFEDPVVIWGISEVGNIRWSALTLGDRNILKESAAYGLVYGIACATHSHGAQSFCGIARPDREYTDAECEEIYALFVTFHEQISTFETLDPKASEQLRLFASQVSGKPEKGPLK